MASHTMECPKKLVGRVIGKGGDTINTMQTETHAHIQIMQDVPEGQPVQVVITGPPTAVQMATYLLTEIINNNGRETSVAWVKQAAQQYLLAQQQQMQLQQMQMQMAQMRQAFIPSFPVLPTPGAWGGLGLPLGGLMPPAMGVGMPPVAPGAATPPLPPASLLWQQYHTPEGKPYWHNRATGQSVWERPPA
eukprot:RCo040678